MHSEGRRLKRLSQSMDSLDAIMQNLGLAETAAARRPPTPNDTYLKSVDEEWDMYLCSTEKRPFFHNKRSGETRWKPPRKRLHAKLPRSPNSLFRRDEVPRAISDEGEAPPPEGYAEYFDATGQVRTYVDHVAKVEWLTAFDADNRRYFYRKGSDSSTWRLPPLEDVEASFRCEATDNRLQSWQSKFVILFNSCYLRVCSDTKDFRHGDFVLNLAECEVRITSTSDLEIVGADCDISLRWRQRGEAKHWLERLTRCSPTRSRSVPASPTLVKRIEESSTSTSIPRLGGEHHSKFGKNKALLTRKSSLRQTFRKMAETVHLRPKQPNPSGLGRVMSMSRSVQRLLDRRRSKEEIVKLGILQPEAVFGNHLKNLPAAGEAGLPEFLVRCVTKIESMVATEGLYRINGDAAAVQTLRFEIDVNNYRLFNATKEASLLTSTLKLFFRELPEPLIDRRLRDRLASAAGHAAAMRACIFGAGGGEAIEMNALAYVLRHLHRVAQEPANRMDARSLATVISPSLVHTAVASRRPESMMSEIERNNDIIETLITHVDEIFSK